MIRYNVRSRYLVDLINEVKAEKLILAPFFQRKLVWRIAHKVDFIKTIRLGFPFPEIFIARGDIDLESMESTSALVDGQQRMSTIREFLGDKFEVDGELYSDMSPADKESFLKYEIAIIDLDMQHDDVRIIDLFKRLNRTFYALSTIEKLATEYGASEFMLTAKLLAGELKDTPDADESISPDRHEYDPNLSEIFTQWASQQRIASYLRLILDSSIFSKYEISRQVHLMFTLNVMATLVDGFYNRNDGATRFLDSKSDSFPERQHIIEAIEAGAAYFNRIKLRPDSFWYTKSNAFSLLVLLAQEHMNLKPKDLVPIKNALNAFADDTPNDYALAAKEGVNNRKERLIRAEYIRLLVQP